MNMLHSTAKNVNFKSRRTALKALSLALTLPFAHAAQSQELALATAINRAGRLRALSQRFAKAHGQIALGVLPEKGQEILTTAQALMQSSLKDLKASQQKSGQAATAGLLDKVEVEMKALLAFSSVVPTKKSAVEISEQSDRLLAAADKLTLAYTEGSRVGSGKLVNVAGRQRLVSQRVAKLYFLSNLGHGGEEIRREIQKLRGEFTASMELLTNAALQTPNIRAYLDLGRSQWMFLDLALQGKNGDLTQMRNVATSSERVLEVMNDLANEYEIVLKELV